MEKGITKLSKNQLHLIGDTFDRPFYFFASLKIERVFFTYSRTREGARKDIFDYIEIFYNNKRQHSYLGNISPKGYEKLWQLKKAA